MHFPTESKNVQLWCGLAFHCQCNFFLEMSFHWYADYLHLATLHFSHSPHLRWLPSFPADDAQPLRISDTCYFCILMKSNSHLQAAHNLSPGPRSGVRAWGTLKIWGQWKIIKKINMHVFPKTFVVVMMHNCKAMFWRVSVQNRPVQNRPFIIDHSKQTTFKTDPFITNPFITDSVHNRPRS